MALKQFTSWSPEDHIKFVEALCNYPALWDSESTLYRNRTANNDAQDALMALFPNYFPTRNDVGKKVNSVRTSYRKDMRKPPDSTNRPRSKWLFVADRMFRKNYFENTGDQFEVDKYSKAPAQASNPDEYGQSDEDIEDHQSESNIWQDASEPSYSSHNGQRTIPNNSTMTNGLTNGMTNGHTSKFFEYEGLVEAQLLDPSPQRVQMSSIHHQNVPSSSKRTRFANNQLDDGMPMNNFFETIVSEGLKGMATNQREAKERHPDYYYYEYIKDLTVSWTSEQRRKLRKQINHLVEHMEMEIEQQPASQQQQQKF